MATRRFLGTVNSDWNTAGNWDDGAGGAGAVPTAADDVIFTALSPACTLSANGACLTLNQTGFTSTLTLNTFQIAVSGTTFLLVANGWVKGSHAQEVDFLAVAGTVAITTAGNEINSIRAGNAGAGGTYQLQDALTITLDLDLVRGTWQFNNQNAVIKRDLYCRNTMAANGCALGSGTIEVQRDAEFRVSGVVSRGTSTFRMTGTGAMRIYGATSQSFYNLYLAAPGQTTTLSQNVNAFGGFSVYNVLTAGSGSILVGGTQAQYMSNLTALFSTGGPAVPINIDAAAVINFSPSANGIALSAVGGGQAGTFDFFLPTVMAAPFTILTSSAGVCTFRPGRSCSVGSFSAGDGSSSHSLVIVDFNGFNITTVGDFQCPPSGRSGFAVNVGASTLTVGQDLTLDWPVAAQGYTMRALGTVSVGRDFLLHRVTGNSSPGLLFGPSTLLIVGRNWDSGDADNQRTFQLPDYGTVRFTAAGAFTFTHRTDQMFCTIEVSGGGTATLPAGLNCYNLLVYNGTLTTGGDLTVRNSYNASGGTSVTITANMSVGSSFSSAGTTVTAGSNIIATGAVCSISGVNPNTLTMASTCIRLQLLAAMNIGTLVFADRQTPGILQLKSSATFAVTTLNSLVVRSDCPVQVVSSAAGTRYTLTVTTPTSLANLWPRDCRATNPLTGNLTNVDLGNNLGWSLNTLGIVRIITEDPGADELAAAGFGLYEYCWLVDTTLVGLIAKAAAFAGGANNWHRRTNVPLAYLDNLNIGTTYYVALGLRDERDRRLAPNVGAGDYSTGPGIAYGTAADLESVVNSFAMPWGG